MTSRTEPDHEPHGKPLEDRLLEPQTSEGSNSMKSTIHNLARDIGESASKLALRARGRATDTVSSWNSQIIAEAEGDATKGTRWGRGALVMVPSLAIVAGLGSAISQGALAANFNVANQPVTLAIGSVDAQGLGIVMAQANVKNPDGSTEPTAILHAVLGSGSIDDVCLIARQSMLGVTYSVVISAPKNEQKASGANVQFDVTGLQAKGVKLTNALIGRSADDISVNGQSLGGQPGGFGLDASEGTAVLNDVTGTAYGASILGSLEAPVFEASIKPGEVTTC
jgi:hypothetical protein